MKNAPLFIRVFVIEGVDTNIEFQEKYLRTVNTKPVPFDTGFIR